MLLYAKKMSDCKLSGVAQEGVPSGFFFFLLLSHKNNKDPWWPLAQFCKVCKMNRILTGSLLSLLSVCLFFSSVLFSLLYPSIHLVWRVRVIGL